MRWIKSTTSKRAFECYPELKTQYGLRNLWGRGYHVESLGDKNVFAILAYIGRQDEKHDLRALECITSGCRQRSWAASTATTTVLSMTGTSSR